MAREFGADQAACGVASQIKVLKEVERKEEHCDKDPCKQGKLLTKRPKESWCTCWQRWTSLKGTPKATAVELWKSMSDDEKNEFKDFAHRGEHDHAMDLVVYSRSSTGLEVVHAPMKQTVEEVEDLATMEHAPQELECGSERHGAKLKIFKDGEQFCHVQP